MKYHTLPKLLVLLGPTASGKSGLAMEIARKFNGEIISADSRQVYRGMDIGTGKITKKEMRGVLHHLLDVASPKTDFNVSKFVPLAEKAIEKIIALRLAPPLRHAQGGLAQGKQLAPKVPIVCGGTGFWIDTLVFGLKIPEVKPDLKLRAKLENLNAEKLFEKLQRLDPRRAKTIDKNNKRRLIRALEIIIKSGKKVPVISYKPKYNCLFIGIKKSRVELDKLIERRLYRRLNQGMVAEVKKLHKSGISWKKMDNFGLEYRYISRYLAGKISRQEMIKRLATEIKKYAKRQMTWFKRNKDIHWIKNKTEASKIIRFFLG
ncbi:MAG: hypothetical protein CEN90_594 [Parcubacteria group bacterium Licking1014_17]|nr:MAG: hypothetical protein CEN90_594 [Parcubacteria group bacterium Licking1014_17]